MLKEVVFEIYPLLKNQLTPDNSLRLGFTVKKLDNLINTLHEQAVVIIRQPKLSKWGYFAVVQDIDGRKIERKQA